MEKTEVWDRVKRSGRSPAGWIRTRDLSVPNATALVVEGADVKTGRARLGHSAPRPTLAIYAEATTEGGRAAPANLGTRLMGDQRKDISFDLENQ